MTSVRELWRAYWFEPSRPTNLGIWRLIFYGTIFWFYSDADFSAWADVPDIFWHPIRLFGVFHSVVLPAETLHVLTIIWTIALGLSCVGLFTRVSTAASFLLGLYLLGLPHNFGKVHHGDAVTVFMMGILAFSRCGDGWSVDRVIALARRPTSAQALHPRYSGEYTWPMRLSCVLMTLVFFGAGTSKLRTSGLRWITSDNMTNMLVNHHYSHHPLVPWGLYLARFRGASSFMAGMSVLFETAAPLALFSRRLRVILIPGLLFMQVGIWLLMGIRFRDFFLLYLLWIPWDRLGDRLVQRSQGQRTYALLYDGSCGLCRRTVALIHALDPLRRVQLHDVHQDWLAIARRYPQLSQHACLEEMHVISPTGRVASGFDSYRALACVIPAGWLALPILYFPGVRPIGRRVYAAIASRRSCPIRQPDGSPFEHSAWSATALESRAVTGEASRETSTHQR